MDGLPVGVTSAEDVETFSLGPVQLKIHDDGSSVGGAVSLIGATVPPRTEGPPQHTHGTFVELFHVTSGTLRIHTGEQHVDVAAGGTVAVPVGVPHTYSNASDEPSSFVTVVSSDHVPQLFRELHTLPVGESGRPDLADIGRLMLQHDTTPWAAP